MKKLFFFSVFFGSSLFSHISRLDNTTAVLEFVKRLVPENPVIVEAGGYNGQDSF